MSNNESLEIGRLGPEHWEAYARLRKQALVLEPDAYALGIEDIKGFDEARWRWLLEECQKAETRSMWFALDNGVPVGVTGGNREPYAHVQHVFTIHGVYLQPDYRRLGYGRAMMEQLLNEWSQKGIKVFSLEVNAQRVAARTLYQSLGFREIGIKEKRYKVAKSYYDVVEMEKRVR